jgi:hypothetical protein
MKIEIPNKKGCFFPRLKKHARRTLRKLLVCFKLGLLLFEILHLCDRKSLQRIMKAVILHNMIIDDERDMNLKIFFDNVSSRAKLHRNPDQTQAFLEACWQIENEETHNQLLSDLVEHQ